MARSGEFDWIAKYFAPLAGTGSFDLQDDAAHVSLDGAQRLAVTQDTILEGVHFLASHSASDVARKALRVNLSDMIAKGVQASHYSLSLGVPDRWTDEDVAEFAAGLASDQSEFDLVLTGGDTYRSPERLCVSVTMMGGMASGSDYVSRLGAKQGDVLFVCGSIGDAALGLLVETGKLDCGNYNEALISAYRVPQVYPEAASLAAEYATASMDISDGLVGDCAKLCAASSVSAEIHAERVLMSDATRHALASDDALLQTILTGGDDYKVLCAVGADRVTAFEKSAQQAGLRVSAIGNVVEEAQNRVSLHHQGVPLSFSKESYSHF